MTTIVLPDIDRSTFEDLKKRIPDLKEIELSLPSRKDVSRTADQTIDRLLGRSRTPVWAWVLAGVGLVALVGIVAAWFAWFRRPTWQSTETWRGRTDTGLGSTRDDAWGGSETLGQGTLDDLDTAPTYQPAASEARATVTSGAATSRSKRDAPSYPIEEA